MSDNAWEDRLNDCVEAGEEVVSGGWWTPANFGAHFIGTLIEYVVDGTQFGDLIRVKGVPFGPDCETTGPEGVYAMGGADLLGKVKPIEPNTDIAIFFTATVDTKKGQDMKVFRVLVGAPVRELASA